METWDLDQLKDALRTMRLEVADELVHSWLRTGIDTAKYGLAAAECSAWRRYDLAALIFDTSWRSGVRPFDACHTLEFAWRDASDSLALAMRADEMSTELGAINFTYEMDKGHLASARQILADIARLCRIEEGIDSPDIERGSLHPFASSVLWQRVWACHSSLQFKKAQRLARCYLAAVEPDEATLLLAMAAFFGFHGESDWAMRQIAAAHLAESSKPEGLSLLLAIAYEAESKANFQEAAAKLDAVRDSYASLSTEARAAIGSAYLYCAFDAIDQNDIGKCLDIVNFITTQFAEEPWAPLFLQARGMATEPVDRDAAVRCYELALKAEPSLRTPFIPDIAADAAAASGRWDVAYAYLERRAAQMRPYYAAIAPEQQTVDTAAPDTFPREGVVLSGWGVGDDVIAYGLLRRHFPDSNFAVALDFRLLAMAQRARPSARFLRQSQVAQFGAEQFWNERRGVPEQVDFLRCTREAATMAQASNFVLLQEDITAVHAARRGKCIAAPDEPIFRVDPARAESMRNWVNMIREGRPAVAIGWRSGLRTRSRARTFLSETQVSEIMRAAPVAWILLQYDWEETEIARIEAAAGTRLLKCPGLDIKMDLEGVAALAIACDLTLCTGVATRDIAAAAGARVLSLHHGRTNAEAWRRDSEWKDNIFPSMSHADPAMGGDGTVRQAIEAARALLR